MDLDKPKPERIPFEKWKPVLAGAILGVAMRLAFHGQPGGTWSAMTPAFIFYVPFAVGAITVFLAERRARRNWDYYALSGTVANLLFVAGTLLIMIEGWICAIVIFPFFAAMGALGGLAMGIVCRVTNWPKHTAVGVAVLPLILGGIGTGNPPERVHSIERSVIVASPAQVVWRQLLNVQDIRPDEFRGSIAYRIGVPPPVSALTASVGDGKGRRVTMGKHVYFDQLEVERREHEFIRWRQRFYPDSFPPGSFDEHVVMGGQYFDVQDISYALAPAGAGTRLTLVMQYRVATSFNFYAEPAARLVLGNLEQTLLHIYATRAENDQAQ